MCGSLELFFCAVICHNYINNAQYGKEFPIRMSLKLLSPDARFYGQNAPNSISTGALPQTPLGEYLTALPDPLAAFLRRRVGKDLGRGRGTGNERKIGNGGDLEGRGVEKGVGIGKGKWKVKGEEMEGCRRRVIKWGVGKGDG